MPHEPKSFLTRVAEAAHRVFSPKAAVEDEVLTAQKIRNKRYRQNWADYKGTTLEHMVEEDGRPHQPINLLKKNIDKINYFSFGNGYDLINDEYADKLKLAATAWGTHRVEDLLRLAQYGSVCGDAYIMVMPTEMKESLVSFNPKTLLFDATINARISVVILNPEFVTPYYDSFDPNVLLGVSVDIPLKSFDKNGRWQTTYQHMTITAEAVLTETRDMNGAVISGTREEVPNQIGSVYVHHIRNYPNGDSVYGLDDVAEVAPLNRELSKEINSVGQIIEYSGDPITLIFGARAKNLTKGPNKIWGGLPKDAKVSNLTLDTNLEAATGNIKRLTSTLHALMGVPEIAMGTEQAISNTSGVALHTMYMPLLERADTKHSIYGPHFVEIAITILKWIEVLNLDIPGVDKDKRSKKLTEEDYAKIRNDTIVKFASVLPKDRLIEAEIQQTLLAAHLQDREGALIALGEPEPADKIKSIDKEFKEMELKGMHEPHAIPTAKVGSNGGTGVNSGAGPNQGENDSDTEEQQGRRRTTNAGSS